MTEDDRTEGGAVNGAHDDGPVRRIAELSLEPDPTFRPRLGRRINRRLLAGDLVKLSVAGFAQAFLQLLSAIVGLAAGEDKGDKT